MGIMFLSILGLKLISWIWFCTLELFSHSTYTRNFCSNTHSFSRLFRRQTLTPNPSSLFSFNKLIISHSFKFLQVLFDKITSCEVLDFFKCQKLNDGLLKKLNVTLINKLKDDAYKAEDLLDEIAYEAPRIQMKAGRFRSSKGQLRKLVAFLDPLKKGRQEREKKLESILARLEYLVQQKDALGLREGVVEKPSAQEIRTTSLVDESWVFCRDGDKEAILELLLSIDSDGNKPLSLLAWVESGKLLLLILSTLTTKQRNALI